MLGRRIMCFLTIFQIISGNGESFQRNSFFMKLVKHTQPKGQRQYPAVALTQGEPICRYKCIAANDSAIDFRGKKSRSVDGDSNATAEITQAPSAKFSIFNLLSDDEEEDDDDNVGGKVKYEEEEEKEEGEDNDDIDFFGPQEEIGSDKLEGTKGESFLKQYHRQSLRFHSLVFPLLMAYKLKFFTVIPLLLGALVLLVGTTGIAGFFFALFAAALGIHVKSHDQ